LVFGISHIKKYADYENIGSQFKAIDSFPTIPYIELLFYYRIFVLDYTILLPYCDIFLLLPSILTLIHTLYGLNRVYDALKTPELS